MKTILTYLIELYQKYLSPDHSIWAKKLNRPPFCKHIPSCSDYMKESIKKKGVIIGVPKGIFRIMRCMPFFKGGYDPVEKNTRKRRKLRKKKAKITKKGIIVIIICILIIIYDGFIIGAKRIEAMKNFPLAFFTLKETNGKSIFPSDFEEINIKSSNSHNINGIYKDAKNKTNNSKTVYYFHPNNGTLNYFSDEIEYISSLGYNVIAYDYPGYGKSEGIPYKENIEIFSRDFYKYIKKKKNIQDKDLILWGSSIGTGIATDFAYKYNYDKLVLISPFISMYDIDNKIFGFSWQQLLFLKNSFIIEDIVEYLNKPVLIIHGNNDKIISFNQGKTVYNNYAYRYLGLSTRVKILKNFIEIDGQGHDSIISKYGDVLKYQFIKFGETGNLEEKVLFLNDEKINELKAENKLKSYDLIKDDSMTKYVNDKICFNEVSYVPDDLVSISSDYVFDTKGNGTLRKEANTNLQLLAKDFYNTFSKKLKIVSAYRSYLYQKGIKDRGCSDEFCAKAGYSEHQTGYAVDIFAASTNYEWQTNKEFNSYFIWFQENAYKYGFHNTYQKGLAIDGYNIEPWHWRYMGVDLATYLYNEELTFAEFYRRQVP